MTIGMMLYQDFFLYVYLILFWVYYRPLYLPTLSIALLFNLYSLWQIRRHEK